MILESSLVSPTDAPPSSPRPWLLLLGVLVLVAACYVPVLGAPFLWDDTHLINLPIVQRLSPLRDYFGGSFWQTDDAGVVHNYYRPLAILSLALDHAWSGDNPSGFHVTNLFFHLAATAILFRLLRRDGATGAVAALASALWALAPRLTEAAAWISGRTDVMAGFFVFCALLAQRSASRLVRISISPLLLLGLFCKETALAGVLAVLIGQWQSALAPTKRAARLAPTVVMFAGYAALRLHAVGLSFSLMQVSASTRLLAVVEALGRYLWMVVVPWFPDAQIGNLQRRHASFLLLGALLCLAVAVGSFRARRLELLRNRYFWMASGALGLALYAIPFSVSAVAADRFLYIPLAGLVLFATPSLTRYAPRWRGAPSVALALVASFAVGTFVRASTWSDEVEFWTVTLRSHPEEPSMASIAMASLFSREGLFRQSLAILQRAAKPGMDARELAIRNTGSTLLRSGRYEEARLVFARLVAQQPANPVYAVQLALCEMCLARFEQARDTLQQALKAAPGDRQLLGLAGQLEHIAAERHELDLLGPSKPLLERARLEESAGLKPEAVHSFGLLLADPAATETTAEEATRLVLRAGDAETRRIFFTRYVQLSAGHTDPKLQISYDAHQLCLAKLERAWPRLGLTL